MKRKMILTAGLILLSGTSSGASSEDIYSAAPIIQKLEVLINWNTKFGYSVRKVPEGNFHAYYSCQRQILNEWEDAYLKALSSTSIHMELISKELFNFQQITAIRRKNAIFHDAAYPGVQDFVTKEIEERRASNLWPTGSASLTFSFNQINEDFYLKNRDMCSEMELLEKVGSTFTSRPKITAGTLAYDASEIEYNWVKNGNGGIDLITTIRQKDGYQISPYIEMALSAFSLSPPKMKVVQSEYSDLLYGEILKDVFYAISF